MAKKNLWHANSNGTVYVRDSKTGKSKRKLRPYQRGKYAHKKGKYLYPKKRPNTIAIPKKRPRGKYARKKGKYLYPIRRPNTIAIGPQWNRVFLAYPRGILKYSHNGRKFHGYSYNKRPVNINAIEISHKYDTGTFYTARWDGTIGIHNARNGALRKSLIGHKKPVTSLAVNKYNR